jgi:hypothetical protein
MVTLAARLTLAVSNLACLCILSQQLQEHSICAFLDDIAATHLNVSPSPAPTLTAVKRCQHVSCLHLTAAAEQLRRRVWSAKHPVNAISVSCVYKLIARRYAIAHTLSVTAAWLSRLQFQFHAPRQRSVDSMTDRNTMPE